MATPTFVATKIGDQYVMVPKNPAATRDGACCLLSGAALVAVGAWKRGLGGLALSLVGADLLARGASGMVMESFPASDPPGRTVVVTP
jgi:uncharacterized membrane protein